MKIHEIDNSLNNLGKTVLWQYDRAVRLLSVMKYMQVLYHCAVEQFWQFWTEKVLAIDTCGALGCSVWGIFLGVPRPTVKDEDGKDRLIVTSVYRRILKGAFYLMKTSSSFEDILGYLEIVFGVGGDENLSKWSVYVSEYGWTTNIDELNDVYKSGIAYAKGDIFSYDRLGEGILRNWKCTRDISKAENTSFDAIADYVVSTNEPTTGMADDETLLLKLYDPEGVCRKIGGAPTNSLSITVEYEFGETTIRAVATRRRKCGVTITDNEDLSMEYGKSAYYDEMHRDQKLLFEQRLSDFCPYPLGIKTNEPVEHYIVGFGREELPKELDGQPFVEYDAAKTYPAGTLIYGREGESSGTLEYHDWGIVHTKTGDIEYIEGSRYLLFRLKVQLSPNTSSFMGLTARPWLAEFLGEVYTAGNMPYQYHADCFFPKGLIFNHRDSSGVVYSYVCLQDIPQESNVSFDAISSMVKKTIGPPQIGGIAANDSLVIDLRKLHFPYRKMGYGLEENPNYRNYMSGLEMRPIYILYPGTTFLATIGALEWAVTLGQNSGGIMIGIGSHEYESIYSEKVRNGYALWIKDGDPIDQIMVELGRIAVDLNLQRKIASKAADFVPSEYTYVQPGMAVEHDGETLSVTNNWNSKNGISSLISSSYPIWNSVLSVGDYPYDSSLH